MVPLAPRIALRNSILAGDHVFVYSALKVHDFSQKERKMDHSFLATQEGELENALVFFEGDYRRIFRYIMNMVRDTMEAEDLTQETFLRAYRRRDSLRDEGARTTWLYRIATNVCYDRFRQYARREPMESQTDIDQVDVAEPDTPSLQKAIERDDMSACVQDYLNGLSDSYRAVILLHDMHELTSPEIAQLLGESLDAVKIRLHRARRKLRAALEAGCEFSYDERSVLTCDPKD
jgi:RNA polymerase sigma-70 factor (ECF subfamily)